jgi:chemotaxis methyl-accepting protein methylase
VTNLSELVHSADVVMLHNVFEFFLPEAQQEAAWRFLRESVKPGAILITTPPLSTSLMHLKV